MDGNLKKIERLLFVVILLLIVNIGLSIFPRTDVTEEPLYSGERILPAYVTLEVRESMMKKIQELFNKGDAKGLYDIFGPFLKKTLSYEEYLKRIQSMMYFGKVQLFNYTHYNLVGVDDKGNRIFRLYYNTKFSTGFGTTKITILSREKDYEIIGFHFSMPSVGPDPLTEEQAVPQGV